MSKKIAKEFVTSLILILIGTVANSQIPVGLKFDINGQPMNGYFDPFTYSPSKKLSVVHNSDSYEIGYYYDSLDNKVIGQIKFENDKIWYRKDEGSNSQKIKPDEIKYFVIGVDSFFVATDFYFKNKIRTKPEFVQYITEFEGLTFAKHYHFTSSLAGNIQPVIIETFLVKAKDSLVWDNFTDNSRFKQNALKYFGHIFFLKSKISSGYYGPDDMLSIIKFAEYYKKYQNSNLIYYDKFWQEQNSKEKAIYSARIENIVDSIWTVNYFKDSLKLYTANYSSFFPNRKNGLFTSFYSDGTIRQTIYYTNDKPKEVMLFDKSGQLNRHYQYIETKISNSKETNINIKYLSVSDSAGNNLIESKNSFELRIEDDVNHVFYTNQFINKELTSSWRIKNGDSIFQITNPNYDFKVKSIQKNLDAYMLDKHYNNALSINAQGILLVTFEIDNKGYVMDYSILNSIHPEIDNIIVGYIENKFLCNQEYKLNFKPFTKDKKKQFCEIVIPIEFGINRFYRQPPSYNYYFMNMQMHQQMMNNYRAPVPTVRMGGF